MMLLRRKKTLILKTLMVPALLISLLIFFKTTGLEPGIGHMDDGPYVTLSKEDPPQEGIILLEGYGSPRLTPRMWCALESAARTHPERQVSMLMTSPIIKETELLSTLQNNLPNLKILHLNPELLFRDTILEDFYKEKKWIGSYWPKSHFNDVLRWLILSKYGGIYLDADVIVIRSLSALPNCTGMESSKYAAAGVLKFTPKHPVIEKCVENIAEHFDGTVWGANGPELITDVLQTLCGMKLPSGETPLCDDVKVMSTKAFYPIPWWDWKLYVTEDEDLAHSLLEDPSIYVLHVWNLHSQHVRVELNSYQPYAHAARLHCPSTAMHEGPYI